MCDRPNPPDEDPVILCSLTAERDREIAKIVGSIKRAAALEANVSEAELEETGLFGAAIERLRGITAATTDKKRAFMRDILNHLKLEKVIEEWNFSGSGERYDYEIRMPGGLISVVETKGCLDGNNTNIFQRPPQAEEFVIWSLCQNAGADPRRNAWSGLHTRLSAEVISRRERVDAVVIWDMLCGTRGRECPKLLGNPNRATTIQTPDGPRSVPPPCIYLFPRTQLDPRNNPKPEVNRVQDIRLVDALYKAFRGAPSDVVEVRIEVRTHNADIQRRTTLVRQGRVLRESRWTSVKRARQ